VYERFTDRARKVLKLAKEEAQRYHHDYLGTEHILLGLVKEGAGVAAYVLNHLGLDLPKARRELEKIVEQGPFTMTMAKIVTSPRAERIIELAREEALELEHHYVGTEHLLLALASDYEGVAAQVLIGLGINLEDVRREVLDVLAHPAPSIDPSPAGSRKPAEPDFLKTLPSEIQEEAAKLDRLLAQLNEEKALAVSEQEFERAATLREACAVLKKHRKAIIRVGVETQKDRQFEEQVAAVSGQIQELLTQRDQTIAAGDFDKAMELAAELDRLRTQRKDIIFGRPGRG
jgi:ATP-dependent Clp protease ATP-binding subunit ClpC